MFPMFLALVYECGWPDLSLIVPLMVYHGCI